MSITDMSKVFGSSRPLVERERAVAQNEALLRQVAEIQNRKDEVLNELSILLQCGVENRLQEVESAVDALSNAISLLLYHLGYEDDDEEEEQ